LTTIRIITRRF